MSPPHPADSTPPALAALLARIARADERALRALYDLTAAKLFGVALRILVKPEWAEEALQESFVNIWRHAGEYRESLAAPLTWMTAIVRNRALDHLRRQKAVLADGTPALAEWTDGLDELLAGDERDPADAALISEEARRLSVCMGRLDASQRQAVALAYLRDQSHGEIAQTLSVPLGTVKSWVRRGLEKLKACMGGL
ncbi:sigma-70 family RNA polymerase sigma factor [Trinickia caryophylli]|uniref:RNA polymerase, sigma subunit, ECF family n=1 Tax=Trinickia caryophylli TaxID=28094 RepID=A0A1X7GY14_TRICW|nr:sigma-70 family RNA polymerase sigma factor [Trinickia caryophylli]PMS10137.1 RNA polymerase subunit sigma-24 [Trinickia caryophylli]TRX18238.1 sigma-70 family RNA polymerase sigma factor [Trinickia caryophylli]WQE10976.1 sigma-70 family RNA polymerase sigma factor [Trinickia caryophylli]SMF76532.1 RNA polymerase, sigma subunit, ECF family [Trinickia caryophylli]